MWTRFQWHRRRRARVAFMLLPALLYRAAIPAGSMPMVDGDGRLAIMFCPGEIEVRQVSGVHAAHHHQHHHDSENAEPTPGQHVPCPFAASAGPGPLPVVLLVTNPAPKPGYAPAQITARAFSPAIVRAQAARAPPPSPNY